MIAEAGGGLGQTRPCLDVLGSSVSSTDAASSPPETAHEHAVVLRTAPDSARRLERRSEPVRRRAETKINVRPELSLARRSWTRWFNC